VHDALKNELDGGVMPSKYFKENAAWLRPAVICAQSADGLETDCLARGTVARPAQAAAFFDSQVTPRKPLSFGGWVIHPRPILRCPFCSANNVTIPTDLSRIW
jgi:hypothetical protein